MTKENKFKTLGFVGKLSTCLLCMAMLSCGEDGDKPEPEPTPDPEPVAVSGVTLNRTTLSLVVGDSETLMATIMPADAANKNVKWSSSNEAIATVGGDGKVWIPGGQE